MTINPTGAIVQEHIYASERKGETDDERVIAVKDGPLRMEFFHRHVSDGYRSYWQAPLDSVKTMVQELSDYAARTEGKGGVVGLGIRSEEIKGVSHDSLWRSMTESIREPCRFFVCSDVAIKECKGFVQRTITASGETYVENIYSDEPSCEIVFRKLLNGSETDVERVVALRTHPLQIEFHRRNTADGFRVQWDMPKSAPLGSVEAFVREAKSMEGAQPTTVGFGITSDPIREGSYDSLFAAVEIAIKEPWRAIEVEQAGCSVEDCQGYTLRKMKLKATSECVVERIIINEESGFVSYNKCDASGRSGDVERVLAIHKPLRLEFFERSARSGLRVDWKAPYNMACDTFSNIVQMAKTIETRSSDVVGYGLASKPLSGANQDELWKAMLFAMRNPAECGLKVDSVAIRDLNGFMQRSMRLLEKSGKPTVTDNIRVLEQAQEITYRPVANGQEGVEERVFALRTDPLRLEMFTRNSKNGMRLDWQAPLSVANEIFDRTTEAAKAPIKKAAAGQCVGMGWTSPEVTTATWDGLWAALVFKARNPEKFNMDVSDVVVADRPGYLARSMTINATGKRVEEHIYASERKGEIIYRLVDPATKGETDDERVIAVKDSPLRMEFFHRHVSDGYRMYWQAPLDSVAQMIRELVEYATRTEGKGSDVGLGVRSEEIKGVSHDALWRSMMLSIRDPARFFPCSGVSIKECNGFVQRTITAGSETYIENIYSDEPSCEIIFRKLVNGAETDVERVVALRTFPLQIEFHQRNQADGFRVHWAMPKSAPLSSVEAFVQEARRMDVSKPSIVGYVITSDPIRDCSYDSLLSAAQLAIKEPWRAIEVDQTGCSIEDCPGYTLRKMKLKATGECVTERITVNEEIGTITYNKCDPNGLPGDVERVLAVHTPLRLEFYERSAKSGLRVDWKAPYVMASDTFSNLVQLAVQIE